jgi:hypothetical protein
MLYEKKSDWIRFVDETIRCDYFFWLTTTIFRDTQLF